MDAGQQTLDLAMDAYPAFHAAPCSAVLRVLVACEYSGRVRDAFAALGHDAMSCDLLPSEADGKHYQGDVREVLDAGWDLMIAHPPCTYLSTSGLHWNDRGRGWQGTNDALDFVRLLLAAPVPRIALENPIGCISSKIRKPEQIIQPHEYGEDASKATCLWLKNLPKLTPTKHIAPRIVDGKKRWANQTDSGQNKLPPSDDRWKIRSATYPGIAAAMATQWGYLRNEVWQPRHSGPNSTENFLAVASTDLVLWRLTTNQHR